MNATFPNLIEVGIGCKYYTFVDPVCMPCANIQQPFHFFIQLSLARGISGSSREQHSVDFLPSFHVVQWLWLFCVRSWERCVDGRGRRGRHLRHQSQRGHGQSGEIVFCGRRLGHGTFEPNLCRQWGGPKLGRPRPGEVPSPKELSSYNQDFFISNVFSSVLVEILLNGT